MGGKKYIDVSGSIPQPDLAASHIAEIGKLGMKKILQKGSLVAFPNTDEPII
jgi:hypothetical protein